jgi:hypothetical protein
MEQREVLQALIKTLLVGKSNPYLSHVQELPQSVRRTAISDLQGERTDNAFGSAMVAWCACSAYEKNTTHVHLHLADVLSPILLAMIAVPEGLSYLKEAWVHGSHNEFDAQVSI